MAGGGAGAGAGSQAGGFVCEKNRGLARVGTLASLNANAARGFRLVSSPRGPGAPPPTRLGREWAPRVSACPGAGSVKDRCRGRRAGVPGGPVSCSRPSSACDADVNSRAVCVSACEWNMLILGRAWPLSHTSALASPPPGGLFLRTGRPPLGSLDLWLPCLVSCCAPVIMVSLLSSYWAAGSLR